MSFRPQILTPLEALESRIAPAALLLFKAQASIGVPDVGVTVEAASSVVEDGSANLSFTFTRTISEGELTVGFTTIGSGFAVDYDILTSLDVTAVASGSGEAIGTITFRDGEATKTLVFDPRADEVVEADETVGVQLSASVAYTSSNFVAFGTILNDDTAFVSVTVDSSTALESSAGAIFTVARTADASLPMTVKFHLAGAADFASDYTLFGVDSFDNSTGEGTVTFPAGISRLSIRLSPTDDAVVEANEAATLSMDAGLGYELSGGAAIVTILDNDADVKVTVVSAGDHVAAGATNEFTITVRNLSAFAVTNLTLTETHYSALAGFTVAAGSDYDAAQNLWTIQSLEAGATATLKLNVHPASSMPEDYAETVTGTVTGANETLQNPDDDTASASATVIRQSDLSVTVTTSAGPFPVGSQVPFHIHLQNDGPSDAQAVTIKSTVSVFESSVGVELPKPGWVDIRGWFWGVERVGGLDVFTFSSDYVDAGASADFTLTLGTAFQTKNTPVTVSSTAASSSLDLNSLNDTSSATVVLAPDPHHPLFAFSLSAQGGAAGAGALPVVRVFNAETGLAVKTLHAYESTYRDGVRVAIGDINGDGQDDIVTASRNGSGRIRAFDGLTFERIAIGGQMQINAFTGADAHGAYVALGDVDDDGHLDIIAGSGYGGGKLRVFSGADGKLLSKSSPFGASHTGGIRVAAGDVDGDGRDDVVAGQGALGSKVRVLVSSASANFTFSTAASALRDGVFLATGDVTGDGVAEIIVGRGKAGNSGHASVGVYHVGEVRPELVSSGGRASELFSIPLSDTLYQYGARVAVGALGEDRHPVIMAGAGPLGASTVQVFDPIATAEIDQQYVLPTQDRLGIFVAASAPPSLRSTRPA